MVGKIDLHSSLDGKDPPPTKTLGEYPSISSVLEKSESRVLMPWREMPYISASPRRSRTSSRGSGIVHRRSTLFGSKWVARPAAWASANSQCSGHSARPSCGQAPPRLRRVPANQASCTE